MRIRGQAFIVLPPIIAVFVSVFGLLGYLLELVFGIPSRFGMPVALRGLGVAVLAAGFFILGWLFRYRRPGDILVSTYVTMRKSIMRIRPEETSSRTEPLVLEGPQRHVRHPMYFAVVVLFLGWWLLLDYTFLLIMAFLLSLWYNLVVIRFEEEELKALYGEEYEAYAKAVPRFIPSLRSKWH